MRPELELIERIEKYLTGELPAAEKAVFEAQLATDADLREAVGLQRDILSGLERASLSSSIGKARHRFYRRMGFRWGGFGLGLGLLALVAILLLAPHSHRFGIVPGMPANTHGELYVVDTRHDTLLRTAHGAILQIPAGSIAANGAGPVRLEIKEAYTIEAMVRYGLLTQSDGRPLSSGGMIEIQPADGSDAKIVRPIKVALPTLRVEEKMQLFKGVTDKKGRINWTDPRPLEDSSVRKAIAYGRSLFQTNCGSCHAVRSVLIGPALAYIDQRRPAKWINDFVRNNTAVLARDCYANYVFKVFNKTPMNTFPHLSDVDMRYMMDYINSESQLIDSNRVPNYTQEFDSCLRYKRLVGRLEQNRQVLIAGNGPRTQIIRHYDSSVLGRQNDTGTLITDTAVIVTTPASVRTVTHEAIYYQFTVESFGWYNVDALLKELPGILPSELRVHMKPEYAAEVNVFLVLPGRKIFIEGGFLKESKTDFGFLTEDGQIPLPQGEQAYVFATGEYRGKPVFAVSGFMTALKQTIDLEPVAMTKEDITERISHLDLNRLGIRVADSRNAIRIRKVDTALAAIARFKPQHCDCDCQFDEARDSVDFQ